MANTDLTSQNAVMKELYGQPIQTVEDLVYRTNPLLALLKKDESAGGKYIPVPIITSPGTSSSTFSSALSDQSPSESNAFLMTRKKDYAIATIDWETVLASQTDKEAFVKALKFAVDGAFRGCTNRIATKLFLDGTGTFGAISTIGSVGTGIIQLTNVGDVARFEKNDVLQANATSGGTPRATLGYVIAVNRRAGQITVSDTSVTGAAGNPTGWTTSDSLLIRGNNNACIAGLSAWLPSTAPTTGDSFYGVDRSEEVERLSGWYHDGSGQNIEEAIIDLLSFVSREGGMPDKFITNPISYAALEKQLGSKVQYTTLEGPGKIRFNALKINGPSGVIDVLQDRSCPSATGFALQMDTWTLLSLDRAPHVEDYGSDEFLRTTADAVEARVNSYSNLACNAPGWNGRVLLPV